MLQATTAVAAAKAVATVSPPPALGRAMLATAVASLAETLPPGDCGLGKGGGGASAAVPCGSCCRGA